MKVRDVMTQPVVSVDGEAPISLAIRLMLQKKISGLPVVDPLGNLVGVVTEGDFLRRAETGTQQSQPRWLEFLVGPGAVAEDYVKAHGRKVGEITVKADPKGHDKVICWAQERFGDELLWAIEDCRHLSARLELDLLDAGQRVVRAPAKLMAEQRRTARTRGKSDPIDALAVARAALREPDLPVATHDEASRELKLLVDRREDLVGERTRMVNRLRWHLHRIAPGDPDADPAPKSLNRAKTRRQLSEWLADKTGIDARRWPVTCWPTSTGSAR